MFDARFNKLESELQVFHFSLEHFNSTITSINNRVNKLEESVKNLELNLEVSISEETAERNKRSCNLTICNLEESDSTTDLVSVKNILECIEPESASGRITQHRLGRNPSDSKPRAIRVSFASRDISLAVTKNKFKYKGPARIALDQTFKQRSFLNSLRVGLREMNDPSKSIRYVNGVPKIGSSRRGP